MHFRMGSEELDLIESQLSLRREMIQSGGEEVIHSVSPASVVNKTNRKYENRALNVEVLLREDFDFYMNLISLPRKSVSRSRLFVYGEYLIEFLRSPMYKALKQVFTIIPIWPRVTPPAPNPIPMPDPDDYNLIPSNVKGPCRPVLIIRPDDCDSNMGNQNYRRWLEEDNRFVEGNGRRSFQNPRVIFYGLVLQPYWEPCEDPYSNELIRNFFDVEDCFDDILRKAIQAANNCLESSDGEMNQNIIVQVRQNTIDNGFLKSPSYKTFENEIENLNRRWKNVNGVSLSVQIV